ncbi:RDD family protein [Halobacillus sp. ACCC02827]|uniref:RDD family protein n=1 Tax=Halobacillus sp. ACCC02827 TaxID=3052090 RepID=UPI00257088CE|nr:RDD family protein [Halobacillus sp. ACCC02827]WJE17115.1 RDD family protein [Halobacillus sp. ACCC02827]
MSNPAGFWVRVGARLLDGLILFLVISLVSWLIYGSFTSTDEYRPTNVIGLLYWVLVPTIWSGYTIGKRITGGMRVVKADGSEVSLGTMLLREVVAGLVYVVTLGIALIVSAFMVGMRDDKRAVHDFIAGTYVTYDAPQGASAKNAAEVEV